MIGNHPFSGVKKDASIEEDFSLRPRDPNKIGFRMNLKFHKSSRSSLYLLSMYSQLLILSQINADSVRTRRKHIHNS